MDLRELSAAASSSGYVLLPAPLPGFTYVPAKVFNNSLTRDEEGKAKSRFKKDKKHFSKFYGEVWEALGMRKVLSPNEVYCLTLLFPYCEVNTNFLVNKTNGVPLDLDDIANVIDREGRQVRRIIKSLVDKNLLAKIESGGCLKFCVNPELYWNGGDARQYAHFRSMFYTSRDNKIKAFAAQLKDVSKEERPKIKTLNVNGKRSSIIYQQEVKKSCDAQ